MSNADLSIIVGIFMLVVINGGGDSWLHRNMLRRLSVSPGDASR